MKELSKKGEAFYLKWEERRKKKWQYIFLHGSVYWGLPIAIVLFLFNSHFTIENMQWSKLILSIIVFGIAGIGFGFWQFKRMDAIYWGLNDNDKVQKGVQVLESGQSWHYENLKISLTKDENLIIQNELFWHEKKELSSEELNECFKLIMNDLRRLQRNPEFDEFSKSKKIKVQVFDNTEREKPLIEKVIKNKVA